MSNFQVGSVEVFNDVFSTVLAIGMKRHQKADHGGKHAMVSVGNTIVWKDVSHVLFLKQPNQTWI